MMGDGAAAIAADAEKVMPVMVMTLLNPLLAGILLSGAVSAMMSTASSQLIVVSSSITEDIWTNLRRRPLSEKRLLFLNKFLTLMVGVVAFLLVLVIRITSYNVCYTKLLRHHTNHKRQELIEKQKPLFG